MAVSIQQWNTLTTTLNTEVPGVKGILPSYTRMQQWFVFLLMQVDVGQVCKYSACSHDLQEFCVATLASEPSPNGFKGNSI
jgi:hypothetical protein